MPEPQKGLSDEENRLRARAEDKLTNEDVAHMTKKYLDHINSNLSSSLAARGVVRCMEKSRIIASLKKAVRKVAAQRDNLRKAYVCEARERLQQATQLFHTENERDEARSVAIKEFTQIVADQAEGERHIKAGMLENTQLRERADAAEKRAGELEARIRGWETKWRESQERHAKYTMELEAMVGLLLATETIEDVFKAKQQARKLIERKGE